MRWRVVLQAPNFPLDSIVGQLVNINIELDGKVDAIDSFFGEDIERQAGGTLPAAQGQGTRYQRFGHQCEHQGVEGRHAIYSVTLRPWLWLLTQSSDYKVWQNQSIHDILNTVLSTLPYLLKPVW